jgi:hypothetical protein
VKSSQITIPAIPMLSGNERSLTACPNTRAVTAYAKHRGRKTTERLNAVYADEPARVDPALRRAQSKTIGRDQW